MSKKKQENKPIVKLPKLETLEEFINKRIYQMKTRGHSDDNIVDMISKTIVGTEECKGFNEEELEKFSKEILARVVRKPNLDDIYLLIWDHLGSIDKMSEYIEEEVEEGNIERMAILREKRHAIGMLAELASENQNNQKEEKSISDIVKILRREKD